MTLLQFLIWCEKIGVEELWQHDGNVIVIMEPLPAKYDRVLTRRLRKFKPALLRLLRRPPAGARYALGI